MICILLGGMLITQMPKGTVLLHDDLNNIPSIMLYYTSPTSHLLQGYLLSSKTHKITPCLGTYTAYSEGFLPTSTYKTLLKNTHLYATNFYNFFATTSHHILATIGPITSCLFISPNGHIESPYSSKINMPAMYLNHLKQVHNTYFILGDLINDYSIQYCQIDASSLEILHSKIYPSSEYVIYPFHSSLDTQGNAFFICEQGLSYITPTSEHLNFIPLDFTPSYLVTTPDATLALQLSANTADLNVAEINTSALIDAQIHLPLPDKDLSIVSAQSFQDYLILLTHTKNHPYYSNYILIYDLNKSQLIYCYGLHSTSYYKPLYFSL